MTEPVRTDATAGALRPPSDMTNQEMFDAVVRHLLAQGRPSVRIDGVGCLYRREEESAGVVLRCAIGGLMDDATYTRLSLAWRAAGGGVSIETRSIRRLMIGSEAVREWAGVTLESTPEGLPEIDRLQPAERVHLLVDLQQVHDNMRIWGDTPSLSGLRLELARVARDHGLDASVVAWQEPGS